MNRASVRSGFGGINNRGASRPNSSVDIVNVKASSVSGLSRARDPAAWTDMDWKVSARYGALVHVS
jgi:hypothetical protein